MVLSLPAVSCSAASTSSGTGGRRRRTRPRHYYRGEFDLFDGFGNSGSSRVKAISRVIINKTRPAGWIFTPDSIREPASSGGRTLARVNVRRRQFPTPLMFGVQHDGR